MAESSPAPSPPEAAGTLPEAVGTLPERTDRLLALVLGSNLQGATLRGALYLLVAGAILATVAFLAQ
jgi:hypothetical protein